MVRRRQGGRDMPDGNPVALDVRPRFTANDTTNTGPADRVRLGYFSNAKATSMRSSDSNRHCIGNLSVATPLAAFRCRRQSATPLAPHVRKVLSMGSGENMGRIAASRVIAPMASLKSGNRAVRVFVRDFMGKVEPPMETEVSVAKGCFAADPRPAIILAGLLNARPACARKRAISLPRAEVRNMSPAAGADERRSWFGHAA